MSGVLLVVEAVGITAAAVGVVLAQSPPEDLRSWLDRQDWLHKLVMADDGDPARGLSILPWTEEAPSAPQEPTATTAVEPTQGPLGDTA
jgi:hypothetical protein